MRYKALIQIKIDDKYDKADIHFVKGRLDAIMDRVAKLYDLIEDYDASIEDTKLRNGVYEYA